jgi:hypothetical protein
MNFFLIISGVFLFSTTTVFGQLQIKVFDGMKYFPKKAQILLPNSTVLLNGKLAEQSDFVGVFIVPQGEDLKNLRISVSHADFETQSFEYSSSSVVKYNTSTNKSKYIPVYLGKEAEVYAFSSGARIPARILPRTVMVYSKENRSVVDIATEQIAEITSRYPVEKISKLGTFGLSTNSNEGSQFTLLMDSAFDMKQSTMFAELRSEGFLVGIPGGLSNYMFTQKISFRVCSGAEDNKVFKTLETAFPNCVKTRRRYDNYSIKVPEDYGAAVFELAEKLSDVEGVCKVSLIPIRFDN